jgi:hypothetical protein
VLLICTLSIHGHRFTFKHLCWHSITKILRNGPRAHFPFSVVDSLWADSRRGAASCLAMVAPSPPPPARRVAGQTRAFLFRHREMSSSSSPPPGEPTTVVVVVKRGEEYHVVAAVAGHELETPKAEHHPGLKRLLKIVHLELNEKVLPTRSWTPTWRANYRCFVPARTLNRLVNLTLRVPSQMD